MIPVQKSVTLEQRHGNERVTILHRSMEGNTAETIRKLKKMRRRNVTCRDVSRQVFQTQKGDSPEPELIAINVKIYFFIFVRVLLVVKKESRVSNSVTTVNFFWKGNSLRLWPWRHFWTAPNNFKSCLRILALHVSVSFLGCDGSILPSTDLEGINLGFHKSDSWTACFYYCKRFKENQGFVWLNKNYKPVKYAFKCHCKGITVEKSLSPPTTVISGYDVAKLCGAG